MDQRVRLYRRVEAGADGFARPVYVFTAEYWGRIDDTADSQTVPLSPQAHVESRTTATATMADYVDVPRFGLMRIGTVANGQGHRHGHGGGHGGWPVDDTLASPLYFVRGVHVVRQLRCVRVALEAITPTEFASFTLYEDEDVLDGVHLVETPDA